MTAQERKEGERLRTCRVSKRETTRKKTRAKRDKKQEAVLGIRMFFGPPGSGSIGQRYGFGSFYFLNKVLSQLK
jgi:hypothetical protein